MKFVLFADDTNLLLIGDTLEQLLKGITDEIKKKFKNIWFDCNTLSLNMSKTKTMLLGNCKTDKELKIQINEVIIEMVHEVKLLGVINDNRLNWKPGIRSVLSKMSDTISILNQTKHVLDEKALRILYSSLV